MRNHIPARGTQAAAIYDYIFAPLDAHMKAAPDFQEKWLRMLALRYCSKNLQPQRYDECDEKMVRRLMMRNYQVTLENLRRQRAYVERERARYQERMEARGIPRELWPPYQFKTREQKRRERERQTYIRCCLRYGWPIRWK